jgi:hypothetical protein
LAAYLAGHMFDSENHIFQLAVQFVNQTGKSIFLTGKAGSGKTTFLKYIRETGSKKMTVVAPTGVAAINAGGVTMHSFFQLPFGPYLPTDQYTLLKNVRFNADKRNLLQELELLVMDEISMVRADALDAIDALLRHFRNQPALPFGGVQVLYIGDLFQLPPVVPDNEWEILKGHYKSPFFFDAKVLQEAPPLYLELQKIYRQSDIRFIDILNNIRYNRATTEDLEQLHKHYIPGFEAPRAENFITLTSHNAKAIDINQTELANLPGREHPFEAMLTGEFNEKSFPADKTLRLKEGAQIMFINNDKGEVRRYYNGKIGTIKDIGADKITVTFPGETGEMEVEQETWKNIRYNYNPEKDSIEEEELGTFKQYPIRLAWAITIHKSQGLTFHKAIIDAGASFAAGQVYVALSRLTSMDGLVLRSRIHPHSISTDRRVLAFTELRLAEDSLKQELEREQQKFIGQALVLSFNWSKLVEALQANYDEHDHRAFPDQRKAVLLGKSWLDSATAYNETAVKFTRQLGQLLTAAAENGYGPLQQRTEAAATYFVKALEEELIVPLREHIQEFRVKTKVKKYIKTLREIEIVFTRKKEQIEQAARIASGLIKGMDTTTLLSILQEGKAGRETASGEAGGATGGGEGGGEGGGSMAGGPAGGKVPKGSSPRISLELFLEGNSIADVAARRSMSLTTIESHLTTFITTGELDIAVLVPENKVARIRAVIEEIGGTALTPFKEKLGDEYSFGEIKAVTGYLARLKNF